jgi:hypothetical protein
MSQVALLKRLRGSEQWLAWIGAQLCASFRNELRIPHGLRPRAVDGTTVQGPAAKGIEWRVHYALDLMTLHCDWYELTDAHKGEVLERTTVQAGDVLLADRNYFRPKGVQYVVSRGAHVLVRLRWNHTPFHDLSGQPFHILNHVTDLRVGAVSSFPVQLDLDERSSIGGRVVATKIPAPLAEKAARKCTRRSTKAGHTPDPRSLQAAQYVMVFTTLPEEVMSATEVLELYRFRWQVELAFKRLKQLLKLGRLPHKDPRSARAWIQAKLVVALLLEAMYRNARTLSPWGYRFVDLRPPAH